MTTPKFGRLRTGRKTYREQIEDANKGDRFYAAMAGVAPVAQTELAPKREYVKRERPAGELSELQEQIRVVNWWDKNCHIYKLPPVALFAIPNGGSRGGFEGANLKRSGVRAGVEDLFLAVPGPRADDYHYRGLFLEMKIIGGRVEMEQHAMHRFHENMGYSVKVAYSHLEAIEQIQDYLIPF